MGEKKYLLEIFGKKLAENCILIKPFNETEKIKYKNTTYILSLSDDDKLKLEDKINKYCKKNKDKLINYETILYALDLDFATPIFAFDKKDTKSSKRKIVAINFDDQATFGIYNNSSFETDASEGNDDRLLFYLYKNDLKSFKKIYSDILEEPEFKKSTDKKLDFLRLLFATNIFENFIFFSKVQQAQSAFDETGILIEDHAGYKLSELNHFKSYFDDYPQLKQNGSSLLFASDLLKLQKDVICTGHSALLSDMIITKDGDLNNLTLSTSDVGLVQKNSRNSIGGDSGIDIHIEDQSENVTFENTDFLITNDTQDDSEDLKEVYAPPLSSSPPQFYNDELKMKVEIRKKLVEQQLESIGVDVKTIDNENFLNNIDTATEIIDNGNSQTSPKSLYVAEVNADNIALNNNKECVEDPQKNNAIPTNNSFYDDDSAEETSPGIDCIAEMQEGTSKNDLKLKKVDQLFTNRSGSSNEKNELESFSFYKNLIKQISKLEKFKGPVATEKAEVLKDAIYTNGQKIYDPQLLKVRLKQLLDEKSDLLNQHRDIVPKYLSYFFCGVTIKTKTYKLVTTALGKLEQFDQVSTNSNVLNNKQ